MRQLTVFLAFCAVLAPAAAVAGCGGDEGVPAGAVATVDGEAIEQRSFDHWMAVAARTSGQRDAKVPKPSTPGYDALRDQVLELLVSFRWIEGEARERGISVSDAEVSEEFARQTKLSFPKESDFEAFLERSGQTEQDILTRVRLDLLANKLRDHVTGDEESVSEQQIADYYAENKSSLAKPQVRDLRVVLTRAEAQARGARSALARGGTWNAVAKAHSIDQDSKSRGGRLPGVIEGRQDKALDEAVFAAPKGRLTGPVKTQLGYYVFEVTKVTPASRPTLEQAKPTIRQLLVSGSRQEKLDEFTKRFRAKWKGRTECRAGFVTPDCKNGPKAAPTPEQPTSGAEPAPPQR